MKEVGELQKAKGTLERSAEDVAASNKRAEEDIKHMVRMRQESLTLEKKEYKVKLDGEKAQEIAKVKDDYRGNLEARLGGEVDRIQEMYSQILERLPTVTVRQRDSHVSSSTE